MNKSIVKPEKISIDTLGIMISKLEDRIITKIDNDVGGLAQKVDSLEIKFDALAKQMSYRFDTLGRQVDNIYLNYTSLQEHNMLKNRVKKIENKINLK